MKNARHKTLRLQNLEIEDETGAKRAILTASQVCGTKLAFLDSHEVERINIGLLPSGAGAIELFDVNGRIRMTASVGADGCPTVTLFDARQANRLSLHVSTCNTVSIAMKDRRQRLRSLSGVDSEDSAFASIHDSDGMSRVLLNVGPDGEPAISLQDKVGHPNAIISRRMLVKSTRQGPKTG